MCWRSSPSCLETRLDHLLLLMCTETRSNLFSKPLFFPLQTPEALVSAGQARSMEEKHKDSQELEALKQREQAEKRFRTLQRGTR